MRKQNTSFINEFLELESASGIILIFAAALAIIFANTPLNQFYQLLLTNPR